MVGYLFLAATEGFKWDNGLFDYLLDGEAAETEKKKGVNAFEVLVAPVERSFEVRVSAPPQDYSPPSIPPKPLPSPSPPSKPASKTDSLVEI